MNNISPWGTDPYFVNDEGTKWWKDQHTTDYATRKDNNDISLEVYCFYIESITGYRTRVLVDRNGVLCEDQTLEGIGSKIDVIKLQKYYDMIEDK